MEKLSTAHSLVALTLIGLLMTKGYFLKSLSFGCYFRGPKINQVGYSAGSLLCFVKLY